MAGFRWTIKRKLLALGAGTMLPLLLILAYEVRREFRRQTETAQSELTLASQQAASSVEELLAQMTGHLLVLAHDPAVQRRQVARMDELFRQTLREHPGLENVFAVGPDGRILASAFPLPAGATFTTRDRPWFAEVLALGAPVVGDFQIGRFTGRPVAAMAVSLRDEHDGARGVLVAGLSLRRLHSLFHSLPLRSGMTVTVVDRGNRVLSHTPLQDEGWLGKRLPSPPPVRPGGAMVTRLAWFEGGDRITAVAPVAGSRWRVLVGIPASSLGARARWEIMAISLPLLVLLAASGLVGLAIARRIWQPLEALTRAATRLARGEQVSVRVDSTDEAGELARAFTQMAAQITESRSSLEHRVSELSALSETGGLLTTTLDLAEVLRRLMELARVRLGVDVVRIWLSEGSSEEFRLHAGAGVTQEPGGYRIRLGPGEGLIGWIIDRREPLVLADFREDPRLTNRDWAKAEGLVSFLGVPIMLEDLPVGILTCMSRERRDFSLDEVNLAQLFALPAAVAIRNARLYEDTRSRARELAERNRQLQLLHEAARAMTAEHEVDRLLQRIVETAREFIGAAYGALAVFEDDGRIRQFYTAGLTAEARERLGPLPEGRGLLGYVFKEGHTLRLADATTHPASVGFPSGHPPMRTFLGVPIHLSDRILGAVYLTEKSGGFTADDELVATTLSADAAVAIENARLLLALRQALDDLGATQEQLVQGEALRAVGNLASGMAHHLNNILAVIRGRVQLLLRDAEEPSLRRSLEIVDRATVNGAEVVRQVQEFTRGQPAPETLTLDLNGLVEETLAVTQPRWKAEADERGISIEASAEPGQIPAVTGDPASLREVLVSLLLNAADALPDGGRVTVRTWASDPWVYCSVTDTGLGMSEDVRRQALQPFFTTKGPKRRGLGLSVAHGIIQTHGGTLSIESTPGRGTTVTMGLRSAAMGSAATPALPEPSPARVSPQKILVIDDETEVRELLAEMLATQGHHVSQAASGADGVSMARADRYDLVFTDVIMPGITGWEVAAAIKAVSPATVVVLVTGWADPVARSERAAGCVDQIIQKPFDLGPIAAAVARSAGGRTE
jgi:signal transduction histidine kinase/CheY-like chemotaxis protein